jgi:glycogen synthase
MKILIATSEFAPLASTGDLGNHVRTLALELKRLGHEVSVAIHSTDRFVKAGSPSSQDRNSRCP